MSDTRDWPNICPIIAPYLQSGGSWIRDPTNQTESSLLIEILVISKLSIIRCIAARNVPVKESPSTFRRFDNHLARNVDIFM